MFDVDVQLAVPEWVRQWCGYAADFPPEGTNRVRERGRNEAQKVVQDWHAQGQTHSDSPSRIRSEAHLPQHAGSRGDLGRIDGLGAQQQRRNADAVGQLVQHRRPQGPPISRRHVQPSYVAAKTEPSPAEPSATATARRPGRQGGNLPRVRVRMSHRASEAHPGEGQTAAVQNARLRSHVQLQAGLERQTVRVPAGHPERGLPNDERHFGNQQQQ
uniref:(northern house mosquito) hypothetical protein n=1 Tax=Culex pipiens TaxID=7175 RepID=A0A8D8BCY8_CULPI